jgi:hypothetical protein
MTGASELTGADGLIDPAAFPVRSSDLDIRWLEEQADFCRRIAADVGRATEDAHGIWRGVREHYDAPEAEQLYRTMDPVRSEGERERSIFLEAADRTDAFAEELRPLRKRLQRLEEDAEAFRSQVAGGVWTTAGGVVPGFVWPQDIAVASPDRILDTEIKVAWHQHRTSADRNAELVSDAGRVIDQIREATEAFESRLRTLENPLAAPGAVGVGSLGIGAVGASATAAPMAPDVSGFAPSKRILAGTAEEVREWWDSLTPDQQRALIAAMPLVIGNLNGVPLAFRARANQINIRNEIARLEAEVARLDAQIAAARSTGTGESLGARLARIDQLRAQRDTAASALASYRGYLNLDDAPDDVRKRLRYEYDENGLPTRERTDVQIVAFNPDTSTIATYYGPFDANGDIPDWVRNVAVHSPGTTTRMDDFQRTDQTVYNLYNAANQRRAGDGSGGPTAIIAWAGGVYPATIPEAISSSYERDLGPKMRSFVEGVRVPAGSDLTVTGHSYGGTVVASAERSGLRADRILYVSAAGLGQGVDSVAEFPSTRNTPHYTLMARNDGVVGLIQKNFVHGASALHDGQVIRLETGFQDATDRSSGTIEDTGLKDAHSAVYLEGSTSFDNIVGVITGTRVELFAEDDTTGNRYGGVTWVDGIKHPDYEPQVIDVREWENRPTVIRPKETP